MLCNNKSFIIYTVQVENGKRATSVLLPAFPAPAAPDMPDTQNFAINCTGRTGGQMFPSEKPGGPGVRPDPWGLRGSPF